MDILSLPEFELLYKKIFSESLASIPMSLLIAPMVNNHSVDLYSQMISGLSVSTQIIAASVIKKILEKMDYEFRIAPDRIQRYYVKNRRERTIITIFGEVRYWRTEYIDRTTKKPFIYVDEEIGLIRRQRYDSVVAAMAYEQYSHQVAMAEVGKNLGRMISGFRLDADREKYDISRQQIFNMINRFSSIKTASPLARETPDTLYIMADEKFIHLQQEMEEWRQDCRDKGYTEKDISAMEKNKHFSEMVKLAVVFTAREQELNKDGKPLKTPRWKLKDTYYMAFPHDSKRFWECVADELAKIYDMDKVKRIYILGDGAEWIKAGASELTTQHCKVKFALDRYHLAKAIRTISKDDKYIDRMTDYIVHGDKESFMAMVNSLYADEEMTTAAQNAVKYIQNQMGAAVIMQSEVKIGCAMEQAISHVLAAVFTCIPKAYVSDHLHTYVQARINYKNHQDLIRLYISACDASKDSEKLYEKESAVDLSKENLDFSIFDLKSSTPYYHANLDSVMKKRY